MQRRGTKFLTQRSKKSIKKAREQGYNVFVLPTRRWNESDSRYASRAWKMNKDYFQKQRQYMMDERTSDTPISYTFFKEEFIARKKNFNLLSGEALKNTIRSRYMSKSETAKINIIEGLKKNKELWKEFRERTKVKGRYSAINLDNIQYDKNTGAYVFKVPKGIKSGNIGMNDPFDEMEGSSPMVEYGVKISINYNGTFELTEELDEYGGD